MIISKLENYGKQKVFVFIDETFAFWLYKKEVECYGLVEQHSISDSIFRDIDENVYFYRCKLKALSLLKHMDRTEKELRDRLQREHFREDIIEKTINYVKSFHYIDDKRYAVSYIRMKQKTKSKMQISSGLFSKGIDKSMIEAAYEELVEVEDNLIDAEVEAIERIVNKKIKPGNEISKEEKLKLASSLFRKGFSLDNIKKVLSLHECD